MRIKPTSVYENMLIYYILIACLRVTVSTINPTGADLGMNQGIRGERPTNRLSYGTPPDLLQLSTAMGMF